MTESVADEIGRRRVALGITQGELAGMAGVHRDSVGNIELGKSKSPHPKTLRAVRAALDKAEAESGGPTTSAPKPRTATGPASVIRFSVTGLYGDRTLSIEAPAEHHDALMVLVDRVMTNLAAGRD